VAAVGVEPT